MLSNSKTLRLVGDVVGLELLPADRMIGGLHLPEQHIQWTRNAIIHYVGSKVKEPLLKVGAMVLVNIKDAHPHTSKMQLNGKEIRLYLTEDILAIVNEI